MGLADRLAAAKAEKKPKCLGCDIEAILSDDDRKALHDAAAAGESVRGLAVLLTATLVEDYGRNSGIGDTALRRHLTGGCGGL